MNDTLQALGDIALGDKAKLGTLTSVYGQISTAGKLLTQDLKQLRNIGFDPLTYISRRTGESLEQVTARLNKGGITVEEVTQAIKDATSQGGMFYKGMESASKTVSGQLSTLSDMAPCRSLRACRSRTAAGLYATWDAPKKLALYSAPSPLEP